MLALSCAQIFLLTTTARDHSHQLSMDDDALPHRTRSKRSSRIAPINTTSPLDEHSTSPSHHSADPISARSSFQSHGRALSTTADAVAGLPRSNRFSLSFPVQASDARSPSRFSFPLAQDTIPESSAAPTGPTDTSFLTAIATQERRVLELKEELHRAEADLNALKKQWAKHEANKKRHDVKQVTKLQDLPMFTDLPNEAQPGDPHGSSAWMHQEMERRKALMNLTRSSSRTVFKGSRHARTLSLLAPATSSVPRDGTPTPRQLLPQRSESLHAQTSTTSLDGKTRPPLLSRSSTTGDLTDEVANHATAAINLQDASLDGDLLIRTGKKMATDLKDGFWTFFEDLRQATVGEDATVIPPPHLRRQSSAQTVKLAKKQASRSSLRQTSKDRSIGNRKGDKAAKGTSPARKQAATKKTTPSPLPDLADPSFWSEHGIAQTSPKLVKKTSGRRLQETQRHAKVPSVASSDAWDTWDNDSPQPASSEPESRSSSAASESATIPSTVSNTTSPRTSTDKDLRKDPIPWPALGKIGPATLRRTASHLMSEWERSLTPDPGQEFTGQHDYLGLGEQALPRPSTSPKPSIVGHEDKERRGKVD
nr:hypothetical protein CFP56_29859 [Quercus suber]